MFMLMCSTFLFLSVDGFSIQPTTTRTAFIPSKFAPEQVSSSSYWTASRHRCLHCSSKTQRHPTSAPPSSFTTTSPTRLASSTRENDSDPLFDGRTTVSLVAGQSLLIVAAIVASWILGKSFVIDIDATSLIQGTLWALPLFVLALLLDGVEDRFPALGDVTIATQRSVLALLGGTFKPWLAVGVSTALGLVAGLGEEMLFRGILQDELSQKLGNVVGMGVTSILFGALHAVTPLYAALATLASVYFGTLYNLWSDGGNLAIPIVTHGVYDIGALLWAHWTVSQMTPQEQQEIANWQGPASSSKE